MKKTKPRTESAPQKKSPKISPARVAAFSVLHRIGQTGAHSAGLLAEAESSLDERDRGLCHQIVLGVLRNQMGLDYEIDRFAGGKRIDAAVRVILRLGLFQLRHLDRVPAHAVINEAVNLAAFARKSSAGGFVNAILRRAGRETVTIDVADPIEALSIETSHPRWLLERWSRKFGIDGAVGIARADNETASLDFRAVNPSVDVVGAENVTDAARLHELAAAGEIYFQDRGSQLIGGLVRLGPGESFLDVCAAPGSKTTQIAHSAGEHRGLFVAGDIHESRVRLLKENCHRQNVRFVEIVQYDASGTLPFAERSFDAVLVDAPCSGTGTIRRNPEIRYSISENDVLQLAEKQRALLDEASKLVKSRGRLIYSTCSLEPEENGGVASWFAETHAEFELVAPAETGMEFDSDGFLSTNPATCGFDGFFAAVFRRRDS